MQNLYTDQIFVQIPITINFSQFSPEGGLLGRLGAGYDPSSVVFPGKDSNLIALLHIPDLLDWTWSFVSYILFLYEPVNFSWGSAVLIFWHFKPEIVLILFLFFGQIWGILWYSWVCTLISLIRPLFYLKLSNSRLRVVLKLFLFLSVFEPHCCYKIVLIKRRV